MIRNFALSIAFLGGCLISVNPCQAAITVADGLVDTVTGESNFDHQFDFQIFPQGFNRPVASDDSNLNPGGGMLEVLISPAPSGLQTAPFTPYYEAFLVGGGVGDTNIALFTGVESGSSARQTPDPGVFDLVFQGGALDGQAAYVDAFAIQINTQNQSDISFELFNTAFSETKPIFTSAPESSNMLEFIGAEQSDLGSFAGWNFNRIQFSNSNVNQSYNLDVLQVRGVSATAVPEPSSLAFALVAGSGVVVRRLRKRRDVATV